MIQVIEKYELYMTPPSSVDNFVDSLAMQARQALKIKAFATLPRKNANFYLHINQALSFAMSFVAQLVSLTLHLLAQALFLCISQKSCTQAGNFVLAPWNAVQRRMARE